MVWMDNARILAILASVMVHVSGGVNLALSPSESLAWTASHYYNAFSRFALPVLVMISGALLLRPEKAQNISQFYRRRLYKIGLPAILWTIFYVLWFDRYFFKDGLLNGDWHHEGRAVAEYARGWVQRILDGKVYYHIWFIYMIPGLYLVAPYIAKAMPVFSRRERLVLVYILFFLCMLAQESDSAYLLSFPPFLCFFVAGYLINKDEIGMKTPPAVLLFITGGLLTALSPPFFEILTGSRRNFYFFSSISPTTVAMGVGMIFLMKNLNFPFFGARATRRLSELTFGIYLLHPACLDMLEQIGVHTRITHPAISVPLIAVLGFLSAAGVTAVIQALPILHHCIPRDTRHYPILDSPKAHGEPAVLIKA